MRIRRRPPLPLSPPFQSPNLSSLQIQEPTTTRRDHHDAGGLLHPDGDLTASKPQSDPHPKQDFKEEKDDASSASSSPYKRTTDAQVHSNERNNVGGKMERDGKDKSIDTVSNHQASASTSGNNDDRVAMNEEEVTVINGKKRRSPAPGVIAEGSRCSRVNGRGWRCNQQTLVGYSLCEHHLGKGRLRSISGVRGGGRKQQAPTIGNGKKARKVRERVRVVKARSISSLLGEAAAGPSVDAMAAAAEGSKALV